MSKEQSVGESFLDPPETMWALPTIFLATILFSMWTLRSGIDFIISIPIIIIYFLLSLVSTRFKLRSITFEKDQELVSIRYMRQGAAWKTLFFGILGSAIPILLPWFVAINSLAAYPEIADGIMVAAMVIYIFIIPILPALANIKNIPILKTTMHASFNRASNDLVHFSIDVNPLDGIWYERRNEAELHESIKDATTDTYQAWLDIDSSQL